MSEEESVGPGDFFKAKVDDRICHGYVTQDCSCIIVTSLDGNKKQISCVLSVPANAEHIKYGGINSLSVPIRAALKAVKLLDERGFGPEEI